MHAPAPASALARLALAVAVLVASAAGAAIAAPADTDPMLALLVARHLVEPVGAMPDPPPDPLRRMQDRAAEMVLVALGSVGVRYRSGGTSEAGGFDCSGFTRHVFGTSLGIALPRSADEQANAPGLVEVPREDLRPGDLVFFDTLRRTFSHVGIYVGENRFVHAPSAGGEVRTEDMEHAYWKKRYTGARRAERVATATAPATASTIARSTGGTAIDPALR
jgi:hypothetical protein